MAVEVGNLLDLRMETPKEKIRHKAGNPDAWVCQCGNEPTINGFFPCDKDGDEMLPSMGSDWENHYVCFGCGRIINADTLGIVGRNLHPRGLA